MDPIQLRPGDKIDGLIHCIISGCFVMSTWKYKRITYKAPPYCKLDPSWAELEGHNVELECTEHGYMRIVADHGLNPYRREL